MQTKKIIKNTDNKCTTCYSSPSEGNPSELFFDNRIWVDSKEAADYLRISVGALRNAVYRKQILARKFRQKLYFNLNELNRMLDISIAR